MATVTAEIVAQESADLAANDHHYTPRQLYYAVCEAVEAPRIAMAPGVIGAGVILLLIGLIASHIPLLAYSVGGCGILLLFYGVRLRVLETHRLASVRARAINYDEFLATFIEPTSAAAESLTGLIDIGAWRPRADAARQQRLIVCDSVENAALVAELLRQEDLEAGIVDAESAEPMVKGRSGIIAVHDASVRGCALALALADQGATDVVDAGVRPREVIGNDFQVIEGAPGARPPRDLAPALEADEIGWLASGYRLELAAFPRTRLAARLRAALGGVDNDQSPSDEPPPTVDAAR